MLHTQYSNLGWLAKRNTQLSFLNPPNFIKCFSLEAKHFVLFALICLISLSSVGSPLSSGNNVGNANNAKCRVENSLNGVELKFCFS